MASSAVLPSVTLYLGAADGSERVESDRVTLDQGVEEVWRSAASAWFLVGAEPAS